MLNLGFFPRFFCKLGPRSPSCHPINYVKELKETHSSVLTLSSLHSSLDSNRRGFFSLCRLSNIRIRLTLSG